MGRDLLSLTYPWDRAESPVWREYMKGKKVLTRCQFEHDGMGCIERIRVGPKETPLCPRHQTNVLKAQRRCQHRSTTGKEAPCYEWVYTLDEVPLCPQHRAAEENEGRPAVTDQDRKDLENRFTYHAPKGNQPTRYNSLRTEGKALARDIVALCPHSRERSLALTKLEEAIFWANASIARNE